MGYELVILREDEENKISLNDWIDYINSDEDFEAVDQFSTLLEEEELVVPAPNSAIWHVEDMEIPFDFSEEEGMISVKNPDFFIIRKMISIGNKLNATVFGEEDEVYDDHFLKAYKKAKPTEEISVWWKFWKKKNK